MTRAQGSGLRAQKESSSGHIAKRLARLAAVQALYQHAFAQEPLSEILRGNVESEFLGLRESEACDEALSGRPDAELFGAIAQGVASHQKELDAVIAGALEAKRSLGRVELLLKVILRAGVFELHHHEKIPAGVIINDYVDVARAFYDGKEPGLVNGILDKIGKKMREC